MHRLLGIRARTAGLTLLAAAPFAFLVRETKAQTPSGSEQVASNHVMDKRWSIDGAATINRVRIDVPGVTRVVVDKTLSKDEAAGAVRIAADSEALADCVEVVALPPNGVQVRFRSKYCEKMRGHLLTSLALANEQRVNEVRARHGGVVVVEDDVLVTQCAQADAELALDGSGMLLAKIKDNVDLRSLRLAIAGNGRLQLETTGSVCLHDKLLMEIAGKGRVAMFAGQVEAPVVKSLLVGKGEVTLVPKDGLHVGKLKSSINGRGSVKYAGNGECAIQRATINGKGRVLAPGIVTDEGTVRTSGEADVTWQVKQALKAGGWSPTTFHYVGQVPARIEGKRINIKPSKVTEIDEVEPWPVPDVKAAFQAICAEYDSSDEHFVNASELRHGFRSFKRSCQVQFNWGKDEEEDDNEDEDNEKKTKKPAKK